MRAGAAGEAFLRVEWFWYTEHIFHRGKQVVIMFGILRSAGRYPARLMTKAAVPARNYMIFWDPVSHKYPEYGLSIETEEDDDEEYENLAGELTSAEYDEYIAKVMGEMDELRDYQYTGWKLVCKI